jgi:23S rRNA (cytidine1920-2'-O)/16S rRNA (cytidine1409-2'-O)-methyltransferase
MRADLLLVKKNLATTRTLAQEMIKNGQVYVIVAGKKRVLKKSSEDFDPDAEFGVTSGFATEFVSRAGHKIKGAGEILEINVESLVCLDVGVSTGGFSDYLLKSGAKSVLGIDVGQDQTHSLVKNDPRFTLLEKINARYLDENSVFQSCIPKGGFDFICVDVSFISAKLILPQLFPFLKSDGKLLVLIKPQFELGPDALNEKGIVKDHALYPELESTIRDFAEESGFTVKNYISSPIEGKDGNKEFFLFLGKNSG